MTRASAVFAVNDCSIRVKSGQPPSSRAHAAILPGELRADGNHRRAVPSLAGPSRTVALHLGVAGKSFTNRRFQPAGAVSVDDPHLPGAGQEVPIQEPVHRLERLFHRFSEKEEFHRRTGRQFLGGGHPPGKANRLPPPPLRFFLEGGAAGSFPRPLLRPVSRGGQVRNLDGSKETVPIRT